MSKIAFHFSRHIDEDKALPPTESPPIQPKQRKFYRKKELVTEGSRKGLFREGFLPISRATFDRLRKKHPDFAINYNENSNGWGLYSLDEILVWFAKNPDKT